MKMRVALAADHGGFVLKTGLIPWLESGGYEVQDLGAYIFNSVDDYPDFAEELAEAVASGKADRAYWSAAAEWGPLSLPIKSRVSAPVCAMTPIRRTRV